MNKHSVLLSKTLVIGIIILFIGMSLVPSTVGIKKEKTTTIDSKSGAYIQDLIDNASDGDTIYIPSGTYYENIIIEKSIYLIGEDKKTTIIDGGGGGDVVKVSADRVTVSGFTIQNSGYYDPNSGIIISSNYNTITGNIITNNNDGIHFWGYDFNTITCNTINSNSQYGIFLWACHFNNIKYNTINSNNNDGMYIQYSDRNNISSNNIISNKINNGIRFRACNSNTILDNKVSSNDGNGISLWGCDYNTISGNNFSNNNENGIILEGGEFNTIIDNNINSNKKNGISLKYYYPTPHSNPVGSNLNKIKGNNVSNNEYGIQLLGKSNVKNKNNVILKNNFIKNTQNAWDNFENSKNFWDDGEYGNYWSDYKERYPYAKPKSSKPWMWDTPYEIIGGDDRDNCPLINQWSKSSSATSAPRNRARFNSLFHWLLERFPSVSTYRYLNT